MGAASLEEEFGTPNALAAGTSAEVTSNFEIVAAIRLRKQIRGEWLLGLSGVLSIALGVLLFAFPVTGALVIIIWIGAYAVLFGAMLIGLAFKLRPHAQSNVPAKPAQHAV